MSNNFTVHDLNVENIFLTQDNGNVLTKNIEQTINANKIFDCKTTFLGEIDIFGSLNINSQIIEGDKILYLKASDYLNIGENTYTNVFGSGAYENYFGKNTAINNYYSGYLIGEFNFDTRPTVNGTGILLSGDLTSQPEATGVSGYLQDQIDVLNNQTGDYFLTSNTGLFLTTGSADSRYINLSGAQTIYGTKSFSNDVYINHLYVTGSETLVNTTNSNVQAPYLILNLTGGAVDGGIFFVTGSGLTGINDSGAVIGFDHSDKFKFGISTRANDLSSLPTIGSVEQITGLSGYLQPQITSLNNQTGNYAIQDDANLIISMSVFI